MNVLPMANLQAPEVHWAGLASILIVLGGAVFGVLVEASAPAKARRPLVITLSILATASACVTLALRWVPALKTPVTLGEYMEDPLTIAAQSVFTIVGFFAALVMTDRIPVGDGVFAGQSSDRLDSATEELSERKGYQRSEIFPLTLSSLGDMMIFPAVDNFVTLLMAPEVMSLSPYIVAATARRRRQLSHESVLKYFVPDAFSSGFLLMGSAFLFGFSNSLRIPALAEAISIHMNMEWTVLMGAFCVMTGLLFKAGAVPFHAWTPDVHTGAPTPATGFTATAVKIAVSVVMIHFYTVAVAHPHWDSLYILATTVAPMTLVGTFTGLMQDDVKRMLAYSSIFHVGFILMGIPAIQKGGTGHVLLYTFGYGLVTVGVFGVITLMRGCDTDGNALGEATSLRKWAGIGRTSPWIAGVMLVFPPPSAGILLTGGFIGKFVVFSDAIKGSIGWFAIVGPVASAATMFYYFRLMRLMFFTEPSGKSVVMKSEGLFALVIAACAIGTLALSVFLGPVLSLLEKIVILIS